MCASGLEPVASLSTTATAPPRGSWQSLKPSAKDLSLWWAPDVYSQGQLRKDVLTEFLLQSEANKQAVNDVVHPAVAEDFMASGYDWLESAILFDSGFDRRIAFDHVICVTAPEPLRVERIMARDHVSRDRALEWIRRQMPQHRMVELSHYVIVNDGVQDIDIQISQINNNINRL